MKFKEDKILQRSEMLFDFFEYIKEESKKYLVQFYQKQRSIQEKSSKHSQGESLGKHLIENPREAPFIEGNPR